MAKSMRAALSNVATNSRRTNSPLPILLVGLALIAFDAYADFQYGNLASGPGGQFAFAAVTAFMVAFFGIVGVRLIEQVLTQWSR